MQKGATSEEQHLRLEKFRQEPVSLPGNWGQVDYSSDGDPPSRLLPSWPATLQKKTFHREHRLSWHSTSPFKFPGDILMVFKLNISEKSIALPINSSTGRPQKLNKQSRHLWEETVIKATASSIITAPTAWSPLPCHSCPVHSGDRRGLHVQRTLPSKISL